MTSWENQLNADNADKKATASSSSAGRPFQRNDGSSLGETLTSSSSTIPSETASTTLLPRFGSRSGTSRFEVRPTPQSRGRLEEVGGRRGDGEEIIPIDILALLTERPFTTQSSRDQNGGAESIEDATEADNG